jgi:aldehyde dehydrogenase (NAD+)
MKRRSLYNDFKKPAFEAVLTETNYVISDLKETIKNIDSWAKPKKVSASF